MTSVTATSQIGQIKAVLRRASDATGTDFDYLLRTAQRESSLKPDVKARTSSATGLFQFIEQTWLATLKNAGHQFGYGKHADAIERMPDGRHNVSDPALRREILALRKDPLAASLMAGAYTRDAAERLTGALGRTPLTGELYVAHFLGPGGAIRLIEAAQSTPHRPAAEIFPRAAKANRFAFYSGNGEKRSALDLYKKLIASYGPGHARFAEVGTPGIGDTSDDRAAPGAVRPAATRVEPAAGHFRLASHFQSIETDAQVSITGRPFQSLFVTTSVPPTETPTDAPPRGTGRIPGAGPLVIIPESVRDRSQTIDRPKVGAIAARSDGGPLNIVPRPPAGLLQNSAPLYGLFRTEPHNA